MSNTAKLIIYITVAFSVGVVIGGLGLFSFFLGEIQKWDLLKKQITSVAVHCLHCDTLLYLQRTPWDRVSCDCESEEEKDLSCRHQNGIRSKRRPVILFLLRAKHEALRGGTI